MRLLLAILLAVPFSTYSAQERFYVGTYTGPGKGDGIYTGVIDSETGRLGPVTLAIKANNPGYLAFSPDGSRLYAVTSDDGGSVAAFSIGKDGELAEINRASSGGAGPCHLSVDPAGKNVLVANYSGGNIVCLPIRGDGGVGAVSSTIAFQGSGPDPARQTRPFAHCIRTDQTGQFVYACDLGTDHVWSYHFDAAAGRFGAPVEPVAQMRPGSGPRHLAFGPGERFAYVNGEMGRDVTVFGRDALTGALTSIQTVRLAFAPPAVTVTTAEILCHPSGKWLYLSSRGDDTFAVFAIGPDGKLSLVQDVPSEVKFPRGFGIDPSGRWLIAAGQNDGRLAVFGIAPKSGKIALNGQEAAAPGAICVVFAAAR